MARKNQSNMPQEELLNAADQTADDSGVQALLGDEEPADFQIAKEATPAPEAVQDGYQEALKYAPTQVFQPPAIQGEIESLRAELYNRTEALSDEIRSVVAARQNGITARIVGLIVECPICGRQIVGPKYEHDWQESPRLGNKQCELKGRMFKAPVIFLEEAPRPARPSSPKPPAPVLTGVE